MTLESPPSLPQAHQQIRLGDNQASMHIWSEAIKHYLSAIECMKAVQNTLHENNLITNIQAQIIQCEKTIDICLLKYRTEETLKLQKQKGLTKNNRIKSTSNLESPKKADRMTLRHNALHLENSVLLDKCGGKDSLVAFIFPKSQTSNETKTNLTPINAKKNQKHESHKIEELQMSYEASKIHLKEAFDYIERLKNENNQLRLQREANMKQEQEQSKLFTSSEEEYSDNELEATL